MVSLVYRRPRKQIRSLACSRYVNNHSFLHFYWFTWMPLEIKCFRQIFIWYISKLLTSLQLVKPHTIEIRITYECIREWWHTSTYEWHKYDIRVHTSDIPMTYEYIQVTYGWHTSNIRMKDEYMRMWCEWHTSTYRWHTSTYEWHTDDIQVYTSDIWMTYKYIRVTYI